MKRGDFIPAPNKNFENSCVEPGLSKKYCPDFATIGKYCDSSNCNKRLHIPFSKWDEKDRMTQIAYIESSGGNMVLHKKNGRNLVADKKHILGDENGPLGETARA